MQSIVKVAACAMVIGAPWGTVTAQEGATGPAGGGRGPREIGASDLRAAARVADRPPVIDGREDDPVWQGADVITGFRQWQPAEDVVPSQRTTARLAVDRRYLYVFLRAFDAAPDSIMSQLSRRDARTPSDYLGITIDSYHDRRTGYHFSVNPDGVQRDLSIVNDGDEDLSWDAVWTSATQRDASGWTAELRIPLSQLRYPNAPEHAFGVMIFREIGRNQERISWPVLRRSQTGYVSQAGEVTGFGALGSPRRIEFLPYAVERNITRAIAPGQARHPWQQQYGADLKVGLTSNVTLDATVNPDFGQVEADPGVLNLSAFEQFFPERRPFFVEGVGIFRFELNCNNGACNGLFYSRRIGRSPQLRGAYGDAGTPTFTPIVAAAKLTGRLGNGLSLGVLNAFTPQVDGTLGRTVEPASNYAVVRLQQDLRDGNSGVGLMLTQVRRRTDRWTDAAMRADALAGGFDGRHRFASNNYEVAAMLSGSLVSGSPEAMARTQRSAAHFFQRPGSPAALDTLRTSLSGYAVRGRIGKTGGGITRWQFTVSQFSPGFETNDLGFLPRADLRSQNFWHQWRMVQPTRWYRMLNLNVNQFSQYNLSGERLAVGGNINGYLQLPTFWGVFGGFALDNPIAGSVNDRASRGGPSVGVSPGAYRWLGVEGDSRKPFAPAIYGSYGRTDEGRSLNWNVEPSVQFRPSTRLQGSVSVGYNANRDAWQWVGNPSEGGITRYTFARLHQQTTSLTARFDVTATRTLSLQLYAQPFITSGRYDNWTALSPTPAARRYAGRFVPYGNGAAPEGFNFKQFRSNAVARWEYRPGSVLFLVWQHGRTQDGLNPGSFQATRDVRDLFRAMPDNTFLLKATYWFSP